MKIKHYEIGAVQLVFLVSLFIATFHNLPLWREILSINERISSPGILFPVSIFIVLVSFFNLILSFTAIRYVFKPLLITILICSATVTYFMNSYGVVIDRSMIVNIFETDIKEAGDLLSVGLFYYVLLLGILPSLLIFYLKINYAPLVREAAKRTLVVLVSFISIVCVVGLQYKDFSFIYRNNRHIRYLVNPSYPLYALYRYFYRRSNKNMEFIKIGDDAKRDYSHREDNKKMLVVLVVGETARAENFEINNYSRGTNPKLKNLNIINFSNVYSCGTATAESIPCMFSHLGREDLRKSNPANYENLLDVLSHAEIDVLWRDNNSGCKGVCKRVKTENLTSMQVPEVCSTEQCYDEILLKDIQQYVKNTNNDMLIVLHQNGSHGPAYYKRSPPDFKLFTPECLNKEVQDCSQQDIINSYDNTILYTDYFLSKVIGYLENIATEYNTALLYLSDHGESLGENGIYLHGLPYFIAPDEQKHIPMMLWLSRGFANILGVDRSCISASSKQRFSHDNLFDTVLGMFQVKTHIYRKDRDIFSRCERVSNI